MRAALESLLRARKLDVTLTADPGAALVRPERLAPTGDAALDAALGGGLRRGHLSEIVGAPSTGRTSLALTALAAAANRGEAVALVDTRDTFDPASAAARGLPLARLLWVRPSTGLGTGPSTGLGTGPSTRLGTGPSTGLGTGPSTGLGTGPSTGLGTDDATRALKACSLILQAGGFGLVVFDLAEIAPAALRRCPWYRTSSTWLRLARAIEGSETVALLAGTERIARSAGGVTIALDAAPPRWQGTAHRARLFTGLPPVPRVVRAR